MHRRGMVTTLPLYGGKCYYAVIDVEALVIGNVINIVEQVAFVLYSIDGFEVWAEKHMIAQPHDAATISRIYRVDIEMVNRSVAAYKRITEDEPVHPPNKAGYEKWCDVRRHIKHACRDHAAVVYAKGPALESSVFYRDIEFRDLADYGCPKYPLMPHDPLAECRYFAQFIPEIRSRALQRDCYYTFWNV